MGSRPLGPSSSLPSFVFINEVTKFIVNKSTSDEIERQALIPEMPKVRVEKACSSKMAVPLDDDDEREAERGDDIYITGPTLGVRAPRIKGEGQGLLPPVIVTVVKSVALLASFVVGLVLAPILAFVVIVGGIVPRILVQVFVWLTLRQSGVSLLPISSAFSAAGYEFYTVLLVLKGEAKLDRIREQFQALLDAKEKGSLKYPQLRKKLCQHFGYACAQIVDNVEVKNQVSLLDLDEDGLGLKQQRIFKLIQNDFQYQNFKALRSDSAADWEALIIPRFAYDRSYEEDDTGFIFGHDYEYELVHKNICLDAVDSPPPTYAIAFRAHSALLSKTDLLSMFKNSLTETRPGFEAPVKKRSKFSIFERLLALPIYCLGLVGWSLAQKLMNWEKVPSFGVNKDDKDVASDKLWMEDAYVLGTSRSINFGAVKAEKQITRTSMSSVVVSCVAGAVRNMLLSQNLPLPSEYRMSIKEFSTKSSALNISIPSHIHRYPLERLAEAFVALGGHSRHDALVSEALRQLTTNAFWICGIFQTEKAQKLYTICHNVQIQLEFWDLGSTPFTAFGGQLVADIFGFNSISGCNADLGVTVTSYAGRLKANIIADNKVLGLGTKTRRNILGEEFTEEFVQISQPCDIMPHLLFRRQALGDSEEDEN